MSLHTFVTLVGKGLKALSPTNMVNGVSPDQIHKLKSEYSTKNKKKSAILNQLLANIEENKNEIDRIRSDWEGSYNSLWAGIKRVSLAILGYLVLFTDVWGLVVLTVVSYTLTFLEGIVNKLGDDNVVRIVDTNIVLDGPHLIFVLFVIAGVGLDEVMSGTMYTGTMFLFGLLSLLLLTYTMYISDKSEIAGFGGRMVAEGIIAFLLYSLLYYGESITIVPSIEIADVAIVLVFSNSVAFILGGVIFIIKHGREFYSNPQKSEG